MNQKTVKNTGKTKMVRQARLEDPPVLRAWAPVGLRLPVSLPNRHEFPNPAPHRMRRAVAESSTAALVKLLYGQEMISGRLLMKIRTVARRSRSCGD